MKGDPTMLLKTNEERADFLTDPTMFMKINYLNCLCHDVDEKKGSCPKPQVENRHEARAKDRPDFSSTSMMTR
jgi:hypothetical protein